MAFFTTPDVEWLYSGVMTTYSSNRLMVAAGLVHHPASNRLAAASGAGASEDDADAGHGWTCDPTPRSRRIDSRTTSVVLVVNTSAAASTPVYFAMTGAAA